MNYPIQLRSGIYDGDGGDIQGWPLMLLAYECFHGIGCPHQIHWLDAGETEDVLKLSQRLSAKGSNLQAYRRIGQENGTMIYVHSGVEDPGSLVASDSLQTS